jgi:hypothetical protein
MISLFASDSVKKILAALLMLSGGLAAQLPNGLAKTIATYVTLVLGSGGILSGGLTSLQPAGLRGVILPRGIEGPTAADPGHFRVS